jgi:ATP-dependent RNA helicase DDX55/SPB4
MDVKYILQLDPPTDPSFFIHRIGRTARTGKSGTAILFLQEQENTFINYLQIKNVDII